MFGFLHWYYCIFVCWLCRILSLLFFSLPPPFPLLVFLDFNFYLFGQVVLTLRKTCRKLVPHLRFVDISLSTKNLTKYLPHHKRIGAPIILALTRFSSFAFLHTPLYQQQQQHAQAIEYIFKFIHASIMNHKQQNKQQNSAKEDAELKKDISQCLTSFNELMRKTSPTLIVAQTFALKVHLCTSFKFPLFLALFYGCVESYLFFLAFFVNLNIIIFRIVVNTLKLNNTIFIYLLIFLLFF